jgi:hypothetical protein
MAVSAWCRRTRSPTGQADEPRAGRRKTLAPGFQSHRNASSKSRPNRKPAAAWTDPATHRLATKCKFKSRLSQTRCHVPLDIGATPGS